jgi:lipopolysaccharide/colanic/teichoic acid biosynthesis glycosyltransferase
MIVERMIERAEGRFGLPLFGKRMFDLAGSAVLLAALAAPLALLALLVALDLRTTPIFRQRRIGWRGKTFDIYKLRTMRNGIPPGEPSAAAEVPFLHVPRDDPRVTRLGRFLRRYSIDELPQLVNVLLGQMSLVGPRPFDVRDFEQGPFLYPGYEEWVSKRHWARPGITGLWQVSGRNSTSFSELIELDLKYVTGWTPGVEFSIICRTLAAAVGGKGCS